MGAVHKDTGCETGSTESPEMLATARLPASAGTSATTGTKAAPGTKETAGRQ